jgi:hypothetical protein
MYPKSCQSLFNNDNFTTELSFFRPAEVLMTGRPKISSFQTQSGVEGENVHINCAATSIPEAKTIEWTYHGSVLDDSK